MSAARPSRTSRLFRLIGIGATAAVAVRLLSVATARAMIRRACTAANDGNADLLLATYADDATLVFPGDSSWGGEYRGKGEIEKFMRRFVEAAVHIDPDDILIQGPPWNMSICVRFTDHALGPRGERVYENRGVIYGKMAWGKITLQEDHENTHAVAAFDEYLLAHDLAPA
jgi:ketosteroid isomerase-like protein